MGILIKKMHQTSGLIYNVYGAYGLKYVEKVTLQMYLDTAATVPWISVFVRFHVLCSNNIYDTCKSINRLSCILVVVKCLFLANW